jgi:hypothetical protein
LPGVATILVVIIATLKEYVRVKELARERQTAQLQQQQLEEKKQKKIKAG